MVGAKAGRTMAGAVRAAAATAAVPETKRRLCKVILLGADPLEREGVGLTAPQIDTGNVADLPVRRGRGGGLPALGSPNLILRSGPLGAEYPPRLAASR